MKKNSHVYVITNDIDRKRTDFADDKPAEFERAIEATGFGKFNWIYLFCTVPSALSTFSESTTLAYILPAAECDLNLSLQDKGVLNAICYTGMILSACFWGFLSDTYGRKKLLSGGYLLTSVFVFLGGFSQTFPMLLLCKFLSGFISCGPYAILTTTLSEFHCAKYRTNILMFLGAIFGFGNIFFPFLAWNILPAPIEIRLGDKIVLHSWNVLLIVTAIPSLVSSIAHMCFPESPKFLMTNGKNDEALRVFKKIYSMNSGQPAETFPINSLIVEHPNETDLKRSKMQTFKSGFQHLRPLFSPPLLQHIILTCFIQFGLMGGLNTLRLWLPQIFQSINDYIFEHGQAASLCAMLDNVRPKPNVTAEVCKVNYENDSVYINSIIVGTTSLVGYFLIGFVVNQLGKKNVLIILGTISGGCSVGLYFAQNSLTVLILSSLVAGLSAICSNTLIAVVVTLFPTTLRTMTVSVVLMFGRSGAITGNLIFPVLLSLGCLPPFITIGGITLLCTYLSLILPKTDLKALE